MRAGGLRRRFLLGSIASAAISLGVFGAVVFVLVATDEEDEADEGGGAPVAEAGELVVESMLLAAPVGVIAAVVTAAAIARRTTRPLDRAIEAARQTSAHDLSHRLEVPAEDGELRELALVQNALFDRLDDGFATLGRFAADASHELRTPLAVMAAELEVALRQPRGSVVWEALAAATLADTLRLSAIVEGLLALARVGADAPGTRAPVSLLERVDGVMAQLESMAEARGVSLTGPPDDAGAVVDANPATLDTAIRNLVENAIRHARSRVAIALVRDVEHHTIAIVVDDDGPGLGEHPERLFEPWVRGRSATRGGGAGLGLAIVRRVAVAHGGSLGAGTAPGGGAQLTLTLPVAA